MIFMQYCINVCTTSLMMKYLIYFMIWVFWPLEFIYLRRFDPFIFENIFLKIFLIRIRPITTTDELRLISWYKLTGAVIYNLARLQFSGNHTLQCSVEILQRAQEILPIPAWYLVTSRLSFNEYHVVWYFAASHRIQGKVLILESRAKYCTAWYLLNMIYAVQRILCIVFKFHTW